MITINSGMGGSRTLHVLTVCVVALVAVGVMYVMKQSDNIELSLGGTWMVTNANQLPSDVLKRKRINLVAHGLDTVCDVRVNGVLLISSTNMFVRHVADAKHVLKEKDNRISVQCESAVNYALRQHQAQASFYPVYPLCPPSHQKGYCHGNHIRRVQSGFGSEMGPAFPSQGIWLSCPLKKQKRECPTTLKTPDIFAVTA
ncbi:hypothetical protein HPB50_003770 [Hyalomma asiaticum]|uniref:Uncharacterized protein n=1 Tax=Hyalomma asiaticum TaxID=266040 RepID=A0ACB7S7A5_HYAAI|nr:hypothetical protein HPB50_003770 [Hyalomma asiaticum]